MTTPGSLREVQMWIAWERSGGVSSEPPLRVSHSAPPSGACQSREPQSGQNAQVSRLPLSVSRVQNFGTPCVTLRPDLVTSTEMPKAEADCLRHSRQWQT